MRAICDYFEYDFHNEWDLELNNQEYRVVLDLYGENDHENVIKTAEERRRAAAGNTAYRQVQVPGADHFYDGEEAQLLAAVTNWLQAHP